MMGRFADAVTGRRTHYHWRKMSPSDLSAALGFSSRFELNNAQIIALLGGTPVEIASEMTDKILAPVWLVAKLTQVAPYLGNAEELTTVDLSVATPLMVDNADDGYGGVSAVPNIVIGIGPAEFSSPVATDSPVGEALVLTVSSDYGAITGGHADNTLIGSIFFTPMGVT